MRITCQLNGRDVVLETTPNECLADALHRCGCFSVKRGCDTGSCGTCTVWVDEQPIASCSFPTARADGHSVTTIEGLQEQARAVAECIVAEGADQCGFCGPGLVMNILALERDVENPTDEQIRDYLAGNLCRCSGYVAQLRGIRKYLEGSS